MLSFLERGMKRLSGNLRSFGRRAERPAIRAQNKAGEPAPLGSEKSGGSLKTSFQTEDFVPLLTPSAILLRKTGTKLPVAERNGYYYESTKQKHSHPRDGKGAVTNQQKSGKGENVPDGLSYRVRSESEDHGHRKSHIRACGTAPYRK